MKRTVLILVATAAVVAGSQTFTPAINHYTPPQAVLTKSELKDGKLLLEFRREQLNQIIHVTMTPSFASGFGAAQVWREVYGCSNGVVVLLKTEHAKVRPAQVTQHPEVIEWPQ